MSNGTVLNGIYAARIHKHNAAEVKEEAEAMVTYFRDKLMVMAAASPVAVETDGYAEPWHDYVQREVPQYVDEMLEQAWQAWAAGYIVDNPEDVEDELERDMSIESGHSGSDSGAEVKPDVTDADGGSRYAGPALFGTRWG